MKEVIGSNHAQFIHNQQHSKKYLCVYSKFIFVVIKFQVRETHSQDVKANLTSPVSRFSVTGLEPGAQYQASLFSYNTKGLSEPVILQASTLRLPEKQLTAEKGKLL